MGNETAEKTVAVLKNYNFHQPDLTAQALRAIWLEAVPNQGIALIKAEQREQAQAVGIPIPVLKAVGDEVARLARKNVPGYLPLARCLWDTYGREGRVVALLALGAMELAAPEELVPLLMELCRGCFSWEDADRLAMDALEPVVRKYPERWLAEMGAWLDDPNPWVRRAGITVIGRLPMKHPAYVAQCLAFAERLLYADELDVKRAISFAIRICAKSDPQAVCTSLEKWVPAAGPGAVWVLCDVIRSLDRKLVPTFAPLRPLYQNWLNAPGISSKDQRSIESALKVFEGS